MGLTTLAVWTLAPAARAQQLVERASVTSAGLESNGNVDAPAISADGRFVAFSSTAPDLVAGDTNLVGDVFVRDRVAGTTARVSVALVAGVEPDGASSHASISGDGRYVAFASSATNLVANIDGNGLSDVFVRDRVAGTTRLVSIVHPLDPNAGQAAFGASYSPAISADGRWVVYYSGAGNITPPGVDTGGKIDALLTDLVTGDTVRLSVGSGGAEPDWHSGTQGPNYPGTTAISADGSIVLFVSEASNLVPNAISGTPTSYVANRVTGTLDVLARRMNGTPTTSDSSHPALSADGRWAVFYSGDSMLVSGDTNGRIDVFVRDLVLAQTTRVSVDTLGNQCTWLGGPVLALVGKPSISSDGRFVAFETIFSNLTPGDTNAKTDVFVHDRQSGVTQMTSLGLGSLPAGNGSYRPALSADGATIAFQSDATNLVANDGNAMPDVFVRRLLPPARIFCLGDGSGAACPCAHGKRGRGCANSRDPRGARLAATGAASIASDSVSLLADGLTHNASALFFQGADLVGGGPGFVFGDGLRCAGGLTVRLGVRTSSTSGACALGGAVPGGPSLAQAGGVAAPGAVRRYQVAYRDAQPYCTNATFNLSNGLELVWEQ